MINKKHLNSSLPYFTHANIKKKIRKENNCIFSSFYTWNDGITN